MKKCFSILAIVMVFEVTKAGAQAASAFSVSAVPSLNIPLGNTLPDAPGVAKYKASYGIALRGQYILPFARAFSAGLVLDADFASLNGSSKTASFLGGAGELGFALYPAPRLDIRLGLRGGLYGGFLEGQSTFTQPYAAASLDLGYLLGPSVGIKGGISYKSYFPFGEIFDGLGIQLAVHVNLGAGKAVLKATPSIDPIFPLFYSYYDKNPAGSLELRNASSLEMRDVAVAFYVPQFMEQPKDCWSADSIGPGERRNLPLYALFKDSIFGVTEATKVAGEIQLSYSYLGRETRERVPVTVTINNRNGMTWDDARKAAAFVTSMDPMVRGFTLPVASMARARGNQAASSNFRIAMAVFDALKVHGVGYVSDPAAPFETKVADTKAVDYLQFPAQTLSYKGGDCDDLSILCAALLESAGIGTAFVTIPGHIYLAFDLGMGASEAKGFFKDAESLIVRDGQAWMPLEITSVQEGFVRAYQTGMREWAAAKAAASGAVYPVREAWKEFAPANTGELVKASAAPPAEAQVAAAFDAEMQRFFIAEYQPRIDALKADIAKGGADTPKFRNRLGVLYARFGMLVEAKAQFELVAAARGQPASLTSAALVNLGNVAYLGARYQEAYDFYQRALTLEPESGIAILGCARAAYELGKTSETNAALDELKRIDPASAARYAYMNSSSGSVNRAASAEKEISSWSEEE